MPCALDKRIGGLVGWWVGYVEKGRGQQKCLYTESLLNVCYLVFCWVLCLEKIIIFCITTYC